MAGEWPVFHPTFRSVAVRSEDVEVTAMLVDAARGQVDCALPTDSDRVSVVVEGCDMTVGLVWGVMFPGEAGMYCAPDWC